ncbi:hypothetical protein [Bradyrhizobium yuanmingense]|uniref:hypothetical protein n=1 Tax=Bradyrhizobium yuanmingense TaxID=108015 RepID=UPI001CD76E01|nr:hypothetical protein [Bradyrhizobium yuanmingense]MCA1530591.1 hypothetical protein [Bradyrhizobium yuanmingense]
MKQAIERLTAAHKTAAHRARSSFSTGSVDSIGRHRSEGADLRLKINIAHSLGQLFPQSGNDLARLNNCHCAK